MNDQTELLNPSVAPVSTPSMYDLLRKRYAPPEWAFLEEVAPATGGGTGYADAVAVNLWRSRGHAIYGFEVKTSRSDWLRELKQPGKPDAVFKFCDHWFIVAPKGIVRPGELPPTWGLLEPRGTGLVVAAEGPRLSAEPITRAFFASLVRRSYEQLERLARQQVAKELAEARALNEKTIELEVAQRTRDHKRLLDGIAKFKEATGIDLDTRYSVPPIEALKLAQRLEPLAGKYSGLHSVAGRLEQAAKIVREALADARVEPTGD